MGDRHVDALFAEAADGLLSGAAQDRFQEHLAGCESCAEAFAGHCAARDALRGLAQARMPVPVRLPAHAPRPVSDPWPRRLGSGLAGRGGLVAVGGLAVAACAVVAVVAISGRQGGTSSVAISQATVAGSADLAAPTPRTVEGAAGAAFGPQSASSSSSGNAIAGAGAAPAAALPTAAPLPPGAGPPSGFSNRVDVRSQGRQGEVLVVATPATAYHPGDQVAIYAALLTGPDTARSDSGAVAQVELRTAPAGGGSSSGSSPAAGGGSVLAAAVRDSSGMYHVTIPASYRGSGSLLVVADVPAGSPSAADAAPIEAQLGLTVG